MKKAGTLELDTFYTGTFETDAPESVASATTALGTIHPKGRELGIQAGANVVAKSVAGECPQGLFTVR